MAIALVQSRKYANGSTTGSAVIGASQSWATPSANNLLLAFVSYSLSGTIRTITTPSGWTQIGTQLASNATNNCGIIAFYKISAGTETTTTFTCSNGTDYMAAVQYELSGIDTTTPINISAGPTQSGSSSTSQTTASATPTVDNGWVFGAVSANGFQGGAPTATGCTVDQFASSTGHGCSGAHSTTLTTNGTARTVAFTMNSADTASTMIVIVAPASTGTAVPAASVAATPRVPAVTVAVPAAAVAVTPLVPSTAASVAVPTATVAVTPQVVGTAIPTHKVEIAFVANPYGTLTWTDVTQWVTEFETKRGKNQELGTPEAGTLTLTLLNPDSRFDPGNAAGPYYPNVTPRRPIRITTSMSGVTYNVWRGFVERWPQTYTMAGALGEVVITATDAFTNVLTATMPPRFGDVIVTDLDIANGHGAYWPMQDAAGTTGTGAATTASYKFGDTNPATIATAGAATTFVSGALRANAAGYFMRTAWNSLSSSTTRAATSPGAGAINGFMYGFECLFRIHVADTNTTHPSVSVLNDGTTATGQRSLFLVHSGTATSGYKLIIGTRSGATSDPGTTTATYGDLTLDTAYHLAWVPVTGGGFKIYVNGVMWYDGTGDSTYALGGSLFTINTATVIAGLVIDLDDVGVYTSNSGLGQLTTTMVGTHYALTGLSGVPQADYPSQLTSARVSAILDSVGWPAGQRVIDTGLSTLSASGSVSGKTALALILEAAQAELGNVFIDGQGRLVFQNRTHRNGASVAITFGDAAGEIPYAGNVTIEYDDTRIVNNVTIAQSVGTTPQTAIRGNAASQTMYGVQSYSVSVPLLNSSDCDGMADTLIARYKDPHQRVEVVEVELSSNNGLANAPTVLAREIGEVARFRRRPRGGTAIDINNVIEGIRTHYIAETGILTVSFQLDPAPSNATY